VNVICYIDGFNLYRAESTRTGHGAPESEGLGVAGQNRWTPAFAGVGPHHSVWRGYSIDQMYTSP